MSTTITEMEITALNEKVRDLCAFLAADDDFVAAQEQINAFEGDKDAQETYAAWQSTASEMQHRYQNEGVKPSAKQLSDLENLQKKVGENPVAANFVEANDLMNEMFSSVLKPVQKTFQLGRVPTEEELNECCGSGG